jgi:CheY-like chemotaxis protein
VPEVGAEDRERLRGVRVLYVEDEKDIAEGGRLLLSSLGIEVEVCLDFAAAAARVRAGGFDVLLCDLSLDDGHDGFELLAIMRASPEATHLPAVVLSAHGGAEDREATRRAGSAATLAKPPTPRRSRTPVLDALQERRAARGAALSADRH